VARFEGTPAATDGRLLLAKIQLQNGQPQAALGVLGPIASEPVDIPSGYAVKLLLAEAYKGAGEPERALGQLDAIIDGAYVPYQRHRALAERGRLLADLGRLEEAALAYQRLVDDESATDDLYRVRLGEIQAMIASGATPQPTTFSAPAPAPPEEGAEPLIPGAEESGSGPAPEVGAGVDTAATQDADSVRESTTESVPDSVPVDSLPADSAAAGGSR
jgi:tetratricopeptide (TPR) repeat protein